MIVGHADLHLVMRNRREGVPQPSLPPIVIGHIEADFGTVLAENGLVPEDLR